MISRGTSRFKLGRVFVHNASSKSKEFHNKVRDIEVALAEAGQNHKQRTDHCAARDSANSRSQAGRSVDVRERRRGNACATGQEAEPICEVQGHRQFRNSLRKNRDSSVDKGTTRGMTTAIWRHAFLLASVQREHSSAAGLRSQLVSAPLRHGFASVALPLCGIAPAAQAVP
jgi:hypothetical protein